MARSPPSRRDLLKAGIGALGLSAIPGIDCSSLPLLPEVNTGNIPTEVVTDPLKTIISPEPIRLYDDMLELAEGNPAQGNHSIVIGPPEGFQIPTGIVLSMPSDDRPYALDVSSLVTGNGQRRWNFEFIRNGNPFEEGVEHYIGFQAVQGAVELIPGGLVAPRFLPPPEFGDAHWFRTIYRGETPEAERTPFQSLIHWSCANLQRGDGINTRLYKVTPTTGGFTHTENPQLSKEDSEAGGGIHDHVITSGPTDSYLVAVAGGGVGDVNKMFSGAGGYNPTRCRHIYVINPPGKDSIPGPIHEEVFSVETIGNEYDTTEVIRGKP